MLLVILLKNLLENLFKNFISYNFATFMYKSGKIIGIYYNNKSDSYASLFFLFFLLKLEDRKDNVKHILYGFLYYFNTKNY